MLLMKAVHTAASPSLGTTLSCTSWDVSVMMEKILKKQPWCVEHFFFLFFFEQKEKCMVVAKPVMH